MSRVDGDRTLRDLAAKCKQDVVALTQFIIPYIQKEIIGLVEVQDWRDRAPPNAPLTPAQHRLARQSRLHRIRCAKTLLAMTPFYAGLKKLVLALY